MSNELTTTLRETVSWSQLNYVPGLHTLQYTQVPLFFIYIKRSCISDTYMYRFITGDCQKQSETLLFNAHVGYARWLRAFIVAATSGSTVVRLKERVAALGQTLKIGRSSEAVPQAARKCFDFSSLLF